MSSEEASVIDVVVDGDNDHDEVVDDNVEEEEEELHNVFSSLVGPPPLVNAEEHDVIHQRVHENRSHVLDLTKDFSESMEDEYGISLSSSKRRRLNRNKVIDLSVDSSDVLCKNEVIDLTHDSCDEHV